MNMNFLQCLVMGFVSGLTEMLPISAEAHRAILGTFFGVDSEDAVFRLLIHFACLVALWLFYRNDIQELQRANELMKIPPRRRKRPLDPAAANTVKLLRSAAAVMIVLRLFTIALAFIGDHLNYLSIPLILNGILLLSPSLVRTGNMNSRNMPRIYGVLMGLGGGLGVVPGISPVAGAMSLGHWRGVDRQYGLRFAHLLLIPGLAIRMVFDLIGIFMGGAAAFSGVGFLAAVAGAVAAGIACNLALKLMNFLSQHGGFSGFAYYSWGTALLCFVLYLMI